MTFETIFEQVVALLQRQRRVSYRALARRDEIDEAFMNDLPWDRAEFFVVSLVKKFYNRSLVGARLVYGKRLSQHRDRGMYYGIASWMGASVPYEGSRGRQGR